MNLFWFLRYLGIACECDAPILEAIWLTSDRLHHELDLLLIPIDIQLRDWGYPKQPLPKYPIETEHHDHEITHNWKWNPRLSTCVYCGIAAKQFAFFIPKKADFIVTFESSITQYFRQFSATEYQIFRNRNDWIEMFLYTLSEPLVGPEIFSKESIDAGPWHRTSKGVWLCSP
jgi:hypothetical protein